MLIIEANSLKPPYAVRVGQKLTIPRRREHTVKAGETGFGIAMNYGLSWKAIATANGLNPSKPVRKGQKLTIPTLTKLGKAPLPAPALDIATPGQALAPSYAWPLPGKVLRAFKPRGAGASWHDGIDIAAAAGDPVRATARGTVIFAGDGPKEYGRTVILHHGARWVSVYSFLDRIAVKRGDKVPAGAKLGTVGTSGVAKIPQLHFEIRRARVAVDPLGKLPVRD